MKGNNYLKNVMKSVAYAAADVTGEYIPDIKEFTSSNKEFGTAVYRAIKNPSQSLKRSVKYIQESKIYKTLDYGIRNLTEDLRTGNFYNKERKDRDDLKFSGLDIENWNDLSEFGIDDNWESNLSSSTNEEITAGDRQIVSSIEGSNAALASATVNAVMSASQNEIVNNRTNTAMMYAQNEKLFGVMHKDMTILGETMQQIYKLQSASLQNIDKNMSEFFTHESKLNTERNQMLKEILEIQRSMYKPANKNNSSKKSSRARWSDINTNGIVDLSAYFDVVKKNISAELGNLIPSGFGEDSNMLASFMTSPLEEVMKYVVKGVIPSTVKAASKELNDTISGVFGTLIGKLANARKSSDGGLLETIAKFLGISTRVDRNIDTSKYEKGPVPFDGITRKAIIDVIPTHLRRIEAALTGRPEEIYNYQSGRWVKVSSIKDEFEKIKKNSIKRATSDIRNAMVPGINAVRKGLDNKPDIDNWDRAVEEFEQFLYSNNGIFNPYASPSKNGISPSKYPQLYRHYNKIATIYKDFDRIESKDKNGKSVTRHTKISTRMGVPKSVMSAREAENDQYRAIEESVGNVFATYFSSPVHDQHGKYGSDGKFKAYNSLRDTTDKLGNTVFDYLLNINKELVWFRENGLPGGGGGGWRRNKYSRNQKPGKTMEEIHNLLNRNSFSSRSTNNSEQYKESALRNISEGKAVDLTDIDENEREALLRLSMMLSNGAIEEYKQEIEGYSNSNAITKFIDKNFVKNNIRSTRDIEEAIKKAEKENENKEELNPKEEKFFQKILNKIRSGGGVIGSIVGASGEAFTNLLYTADQAIYDMMFRAEIKDREGGKKYNGFMESLVGNMKEKFTEISNWFKEDILEPFKKRLGWTDEYKDRIKDGAMNIGSRLWTAFKDANVSVYKPMIDKAKSSITRKSDIANGVKEWDKASYNSATARRARKVRTLAIRNGGDELAEWCEANGFTGSLDEKKVRLGSEFGIPADGLARIRTDEDANRVFAKQYRHHAAGTPSGRPFSGITTLTKGEGFISRSGMGIVPKTGVYNVTTPTHIINRKDMAGLGGRSLSNASIQNDLGKERLAAKRAGFAVAQHGRGTDSIKITNDGVTVNSEEIIKEAKQYVPEAIGGGLVGGILSMVLGLAGGPLIGAALGAGTSILAGSGTLKEKLFGKAGEDGKRDGTGIISKTIVDKFYKYFPDMAKYGLAGILPGLITPLGPVGGLMTGAAFGFLKNNESFTNKYFGEKGALTLNEKTKKILKETYPSALKGAGLGILAKIFLPTPFGVVGNAALGAAIGLMSSTDAFKEGILGKDINGVKVGGVVNAFKDALAPLTNSMKSLGARLIEVFDKNIIDPIARFVTPAIHSIPQIASIIPRKINEHFLNSKFKKNVDEWVSDHITKPLGTIVEKIMTPITKKVMGFITSPVRLIGWVGDKIRGRQIKTGNADYMTASERNEWMMRHGKGDRISATDRVLADIGKEGGMSVDDADKLSTNIVSMVSSKNEVAKSKKAQERRINKILNSYKTADGKGLSKKAKEKIRAALDAGGDNSLDKVRDILTTYAVDGGDVGLTKSQVDVLLKDPSLKLGDEMKKYLSIKDQEKAIENVDKNAMRGELGELFDKLGIDRAKLKDKHFMTKFAKNLQTEVLDRRANDDKSEQEALETENNKIFKNIATSASNIETLLKAIATGDTDELKNLKLKHEDDYKAFEGEINAEFDARIARNKEALGSEFSDKLDSSVNESFTANTRNSMPGMRKKAKKQNENIELIKKHKLSPEEVNASNGDVRKLSVLKDLKFNLDIDAVSKLSGLDRDQFKRLKNNISKKYIRRMLLVRNVTVDDIDFLTNIFNNSIMDQVNEKCRYLLSDEGYDPAKFKSLNEVMNFQGDRASQAQSFGDTAFGAFKDITNKLFGIKDEPKAEEGTSEATPDTTEIATLPGDNLPGNANGTISMHGIGTALLGIGKALWSGTKKVVKGAGKIANSLFKKKESAADGGDAEKAGLLSSLFGGARNLFSRNSGGSANLDETDKAGDGKDIVHVGNGEMITVARDTDGSVSPDTSDSNTRDVLNKLALKERSAQELHDAQLESSEIIKRNFDTTDVKGSKGGKLGWISLLLAGGVLWKTGILKTLFEGVIKPVWTDHLKPWIQNTAGPWIKNTAVPAIGDMFNKGINVLIDKLPAILGTAVGTLIKNLPAVIWNGIKGITKFTGAMLDTIVGNPNNAGATSTVDGASLSETYGSDFVTGLTDQYGNSITASDLASGKYNGKKVYNADGTQSIVENGQVTFKDPSISGSGYAEVVGNGMTHSFAKSAATGKHSLLVKGVDKTSRFLSKHAKKAPGLIGKITTKSAGVAGKAISKPLKWTENLGLRYRGWVNNVVESAADRVMTRAIAEGNEEIVETLVKGDSSRLTKVLQKTFGTGNTVKAVESATESAAKKATNKAIKQGIKEGAEETAEQALKEAGEATIKKGVKGGFLSQLVLKAKNAIAGLFGNSTVQGKLAQAAESTGVKNASSWIGGLKGQVDEIFEEGMEKAVTKVGTDTCKQVLSKALAVVFLVTDFLSGMDRAESILGVTKTSLLEEVIAGLINALCNFLIIPAIFPGTNWIARRIFEWIGTDYEKRVKEADAAYQEYVAQTGSTKSKEEWLESKYSLTGKVKGFVKDSWNGMIEDSKNLGGKIYDAINGETKGGQKGQHLRSMGIYTIDNLTPEEVMAVKDYRKQTGASLEDAINAVMNVGTRPVSANAAGTLTLPTTNNFMPNIISGLDANIGNIDGKFDFSKLNKTLDKAKNGDIDVLSTSYWNQTNKSDGTLQGELGSAYEKLSKLVNLPVLMVRNSLEGLSGGIEEISDTLIGYNDASDEPTARKKKSLTSFIARTIKRIKNFFSDDTSASGTGSYRYGTGKYSKQIDPSIANIRFNSSSDKCYQTIGDSACGPAAAVNAIESMYGRGNAVLSAANYALKNGYKEANGGTMPGFFSDYFNRNGFGSYTSYNRSDIERNIKNGLPTVIMGRNPNGTSSSSPFGENPHYVTVTGIDGKGNAIVQDPESRYDDQLYPLSSLLNNTSLGISAYGRGTISSKEFGSDAEFIWSYLKRMGMTDAGAAGMMGNLYAESSLRSNNVEKAVNNYTKMTDEEYTAAVDSGTIDKNTFLHPRGKNTKNGYGLAQWTSIGRKEGLYNLVKGKGVSIADIGTQMEYLAYELSNSYNSVLNTLKTTNNLSEASDVVLTKFEKPAKKDDPAVKAKRYNYSKQCFNQYNNSGITLTDSYNGNYTPIYMAPGSNSTTSYSSTVSSNTTASSNSTSNLYRLKFDETVLNDVDANGDGEISDDEKKYTSLNRRSSFKDLLSQGFDKISKLIAGSNVQQAMNKVGELFNSDTLNWFELYDKITPTDSKYVESNLSNVNTSREGEKMAGASSIYPQRMVEIARGEIGVKESPAGSDNVKYNDWMWGHLPKDQRNKAWCTTFVSWVADQAKVPGDIIPQEAKSSRLKDWFNIKAERPDIDLNAAEAGDILFEKKENGEIGHAGIVTGRLADIDKNGKEYMALHTIEGNYNDDVQAVKRSTDDTNIYVVRPNYSKYGTGMGNKPLSRYGQFRDSINSKNVEYKFNTTNNIKRNDSKPEIHDNRRTVNYGMAASVAPDYSKFITAIISILTTIADNTDKLNLIVSILNNKLNLDISASDVSNATTNKQSLKSKLANALNSVNAAGNKFNAYNNNIEDGSMNYIISAMNAIASE